VRYFPFIYFSPFAHMSAYATVKAYIRKSNVLFAMRDYTKAIEAIQEAEEHDQDNKHKSEIQQQVYKCQQALFTQRSGENEEETLQRAMRDPEVAVSFS
jgi:stress-induced-phosphoprotein 1